MTHLPFNHLSTPMQSRLGAIIVPRKYAASLFHVRIAASCMMFVDARVYMVISARVAFSSEALFCQLLRLFFAQDILREDGRFVDFSEKENKRRGEAGRGERSDRRRRFGVRLSDKLISRARTIVGKLSCRVRDKTPTARRHQKQKNGHDRKH